MSDALCDLYHQSAALLRDLEAVERGGDLDAAARYLKIMGDHLEPLRRAVDAAGPLFRAISAHPVERRQDNG